MRKIINDPRLPRDRLYKVSEVANLLGIASATVRKKIVDGEIVATKVNGHWRVSFEEIDRYVHERYDGWDGS